MFQDPPPTPVSDVVVTAARLPPAAADAAFSVVRVDAQALKGADRVDVALRRTPAVSLFRRTDSLSANPTTQGISLRAIAPSGAGRALVTLDGVPLNDPFGGWVIWAQATPESLERLDIVRGAGAGAYGAGALTGVIALSERERGGLLDLSTGERGRARAAGSASWLAGETRFTASAAYQADDGYTPVRSDRAGAADTPLDLDSRSAALRVDVPFASAGLGAGELSVRGSTWREARGSGLAGARAKASGDLISATAARRPDGDTPGWRVQAWRATSDLANSSVSVSADRSATTPANDQFQTPSTGWGVNAALRRRLVSGVATVEWELGIDARTAQGETNERFSNPTGAGFTKGREAGGETAVAGLYGDGSWASGPWLIAGGARIDRWRNSDGFRREHDLTSGAVLLDEIDPDRSGEVISARLGVRRALSDTLSARVAAYSGFRPATLNELHRPFRVGNDITEAEAGLTPERLRGIEAGLAREDGRLSWGVTAFWNRISDGIVNVTIGQGPGVFPRAGFVPAGGVLRQRRNAGDITAVGVEGSAAFQINSAVFVRAAAALTDAEADGGDAAPQPTGLRPAQAPRWSATAGLDWRATPRLTIGLDARHESARFDDDLNSRVLGAALTADLRADWSLTERATVWAALDNVFDADVEVSETGSGVEGFGPPRTASIGIRLGY